MADYGFYPTSDLYPNPQPVYDLPPFVKPKLAVKPNGKKLHICSVCKAENKIGSNYCNNCGCRINDTTVYYDQK